VTGDWVSIVYSAATRARYHGRPERVARFAKGSATTLSVLLGGLHFSLAE
jgi:hypothetical protein